MNNTVVKGALMLLLTSLLSVLTSMPDTPTKWLLFGITTIGTLAGYFAQSSLFPSTSETGQINGKDILKGLLISFANCVSTWVATLATETAINWNSLIVTMAGMFIGYLLKQMGTPAPKS